MIKKYDTRQSLSNSVIFGNDLRSGNNFIDSYHIEKRLNIKNNRITYNKAIDQFDLKTLRELSIYLYRSNLMYARLIDYFATLLCYYWVVTPKIRNMKDLSADDISEKWWECLDYIELLNPEKICIEFSKKVFVQGSCYIAIKEKTKKSTSLGIQFLPNDFCRVTKSYLGRDVVDFDVTFFEKKYPKEQDRKQALLVYPQCLAEAYLEYKKSKIKNDTTKWVTIDPNYAFRFSLREDGMPYFVGLALDLLDVQDIKDLTMIKFEQELSKIIVQKFGTNSDGQPIVDLDDLRKFHSDACDMLDEVPGTDVLTTYADVTAIDLQSRQTEGKTNPMENVTKNYYNSAGVSKLLFNADNSGTLKQSLTSDESLMCVLLKQYEEFFQARIDVNFKKGTGKKMRFSIMMPEITTNNKIEMAKLYKDQVTLGFSKFLPAVALGQRQSEVMATFLFENDVLDMVSLMRPPLASNVLSSKTQILEEKKPGRKALPEDEITEKTAANKETL